jgi:hypothetical protein
MNLASGKFGSVRMDMQNIVGELNGERDWSKRKVILQDFNDIAIQLRGYGKAFYQLSSAGLESGVDVIH